MSAARAPAQSLAGGPAAGWPGRSPPDWSWSGSFPIYWIFLTSFKTPLLINEKVPVFWFTPTLENYQHLFDEFSFARILQNSLVITG